MLLRSQYVKYMQTTLLNTILFFLKKCENLLHCIAKDCENLLHCIAKDSLIFSTKNNSVLLKNCGIYAQNFKKCR